MGNYLFAVDVPGALLTRVFKGYNRTFILNECRRTFAVRSATAKISYSIFLPLSIPFSLSFFTMEYRLSITEISGQNYTKPLLWRLYDSAKLCCGIISPIRKFIFIIILLAQCFSKIKSFMRNFASLIFQLIILCIRKLWSSFYFLKREEEELNSCACTLIAFLWTNNKHSFLYINCIFVN